MGPKRALGSKRPSERSPVKKTVQTGSQENQPTDTEPTSTQPKHSEAATDPKPTQPASKPFTFKGHPQPPVDERLFAAKNFLADEDPDRCLDFDTKLSQVEELVAQIESDQVSCDPELFRDVKVKLNVHRGWGAHRKTTPYDTGCCEALLIAPFSTRLISADTTAALGQEGEGQGLGTQMRADHAPFSVNPENDHAAFLARMNEDARKNLDEVEDDTNLLWMESRAYLWAMRDPALIPYWTHPKTGIPTKGIRATDSSRLQVPGSNTGKNRRPSRGWLPAHVIATEAKMNELLRIPAPSPKQFACLQELLCPFEPMNLHDLHAQNESFTEAALLGRLSASQKSAQAQIKARYNDTYRSWLNSLSSNGVYFIIRTPGDPQIIQPGAIYVDDGIMTPEHLETLEKAQALLDRLLANGRMDLTEQESTALDSLMQYSLPSDILEVQNEILQVLEVQGANSMSALDQKNQAKVIELEKTEQERKLRWEDELKRSGGAEFRYLRPAEMKEDKSNILYLPWNLTVIPQVPIQARPDLDLPPHVQNLQEDVNRDLPRNINLPSINQGSLEFRRSLEQLVYPDLRDLLTPYSALRTKEAAHGRLTGDGELQYVTLAAVVHPLWDAWWHGLGTKITIKMPRPEQQNKNPGVMYCRNPRKPIGEDLDTYFTRKAAAINQILSRFASTTSGSEPMEYYDQLYDLCKDLQYPALKKTEEQYQKCYNDGNEEGRERLHRQWEVAFKHWIQSKKGHTIQIKIPNPRIDVDDDPSVVYYRGPLLTPEKCPGLSEYTRKRIQTVQNSSLPTFPADLRSELPPSLQRLIEAHEKSSSPKSKAVLEWHLQAFMNAPPSPKPLSPTINRSDPHSPTASTWVVSANGDAYGSGSGTEASLSPLWSHWSQEQIIETQLNVDLTPLLPEIRTVESEINRLVALFGGGGMPFYLGDPNALAVALRHLDEHNRLTTLLRQFWPNQVYQRWNRAEKYKTVFRFLRRSGHEISAKEYEDTIAAYEEDFLKAHNKWLIEIMSTGVHIQTSSEEAYPTDKAILVFQPGTSLIATETHPEPAFCVLTPEATTRSEIHTSKLVYRSVYDTPPSSTAVNYSTVLRAHLNGQEIRINALLQKRRSSELTWDESELLLGYLGAFMPPSLAKLDSEFRALDERARRDMLTGPELGNWYHMSTAWRKGYDSWLDEFPHDCITIDKGDQIGNEPGVLKLRIEDPWSLQLITRSKNLPLHLQSREDLMNTMASDPAGISDKNKAHFDKVLASLFRPILERFRYLVQDHHRMRICKRSGKDSEDEALMEAIISLGQTILKERIFQSRATRKIRILERVPGDYAIEAVDSTGGLIFPVPETEYASNVHQLFDQLCPPHLEDSKIMFHDLAFRLSTEMDLNEEDLDFLTQNIPDISMMEVDTLTGRVLELLLSCEEEGISDSQTQKELAVALVRLCWKQLMKLPDQAKKIWNILSNSVLPSQSPVLVARKLSGPSTLAPPPLMAPPDEAEVHELEIEINNLIRGEKTNTITIEQQKKLNYLLRALLPPRLRFLKNRIDNLDGQYLATAGLDMMDSLEFADAQDQFEPLFENWKHDISDLGIVLDIWLSTPEAITEACSRARQWKEFVAKPAGSTNFGNISNQLEDVNVQICQEIYVALRQFVEKGCQDQVEVMDQLLLRFVPPEITCQIHQIMTQAQLVQEGSDSEKTSNAMMLHTMKDQLMKSYVRWLTSLTPLQRQKFRSQGRRGQDGPINFTPKAKRRGIQRAAIELALNLLATNQEQHRPKDRFRMVELPPKIQQPEKEVSLCLPLKPEDRPLEQDPFEYTRKMLAFRRWKDYDYSLSRIRTSVDRNGSLHAPENFKGPASIAKVDDVHAAARTQLAVLASIQKGLIEAEKAAPRPLLEQLLLFVDAGLNHDTRHHTLKDDERLSTDGLDLLDEIAGESWDEGRLEDDEDIPWIQNTSDEHDRLEEFEKDMEEIAELPLWEPVPDPDPMQEDSFEIFTQIPHDPTIPSTKGMTGDELRQATGNRRMAKTDGSAGTPHLWDLRSVTRYLRAMELAGRIHLDDLSTGDVLVSRIPLSGHPENKYVVSRAAAATSPGVYTNEEGKLEVRYDASGRVGPPILQPNKFHYLQRLAFRLGRDLKDSAKVLADETPPDKRVEDQVKSRAMSEAEMQNILPADRSEEPWVANLAKPPPRSITLQRMAQDLHKIAPDLAQEAGFEINPGTEITEQQAAALLQMQILEEASNNWEFKFPEKERVWDFASNRLETTTSIINGMPVKGRPRLAQYFHMRRYPLCCQSTATKAIIKKSGPTIQEKPEPVLMPDTNFDAQDQRKAKVRQIKGREPYFSLGESAFERAFLSWRMEQELKDVPEFHIPEKKRRSWCHFGKSKGDDDQDLRRDRYPLPKIPAHWVPDSVSISQKRAHVLEMAKRTPNFPNPGILEYYHTPREIEQIKVQRQWDDHTTKSRAADAAVEERTKKKFETLIPEERNKAYKVLGINQTSGVFIRDEESGKVGEKRRWSSGTSLDDSGKRTKVV